MASPRVHNIPLRTIGATRTARLASVPSGLSLLSVGTAALIRQVREGLPFTMLEVLASATQMDVAALAEIIAIPERTLARRKKALRLAPEESERLVRISQVFEQAKTLFDGDTKHAVAWLSTPKKMLEDCSPFDYSRTELGAQEVMRLIGRLEHGVFS